MQEIDASCIFNVSSVESDLIVSKHVHQTVKRLLVVHPVQ